MDESDFWSSLEYLVCSELELSSEAQRRGLWCDGFIAESYDMDAGRIAGRVWMGLGQRQEQWVFSLILPAGQRGRERNDWGAVIPREQEHGWLGVDWERKTLTIESGTDGFGRRFICVANSPDGVWTVRVFGPSQFCDAPYAYARERDGSTWSFGFGNGSARAEQIRFDWNLPHGSWGIFIDNQCWAIYTHRPALRMNPRRIYSRSGAHAKPYAKQDIAFICAKRRGQRPGTRGFIIDE